jgi:hypothetical protein
MALSLSRNSFALAILSIYLAFAFLVYQAILNSN